MSFILSEKAIINVILQEIQDELRKFIYTLTEPMPYANSWYDNLLECYIGN